MNNYLTILHLNIHSIVTNEKKIQLNHLINQHSPELISLNETFLKPHKHSLEIDGYLVLRHDRSIRLGGGTALCIRANIKGKPIIFDESIKNEYVVGFLAKTAYGEIAIFSLYIAPSNEPLNTNLLAFICKFPKFILTGDLNAKSKLWHCPSDNKRGLELEIVAAKYNLHILNNKKPTFNKSKSIIDLSICSNSMRKKFKKFKVLTYKISDHQPTLTTFKISVEKLSFTINKIDYDLFSRKLEEICPEPVIRDPASIDQAASQLQKSYSEALSIATNSYTISKPNSRSIEIPKSILELIRVKRRSRRRLAKNNSPENRNLFNILNRKVKFLLKKFKNSFVEAKFTELKNFNQSCSKHWEILNNLESENSSKAHPSTLYADNIAYSTNANISDKFGSILSITFGSSTHLNNLPIHQKPESFSEPLISQSEFDIALKSCNKKSAPGNDGISNQLIAISPSNIKSLILNIFQYSLKLGHIPKQWKAAKIIMIHKKGKPKRRIHIVPSNIAS